MKFRYLREGILNKMGKVAGGMAAAGGALQAGKMAHNAIKPKEVSEYDDYDCDEGVIGKTVKYGFAAGAALGAGKMTRNAIKKPKNSDESLAAAINGGRIPRRAKSVSVQESYRRIRESKNDFVEYYAEQIEKAVNIKNLEKFIEREWNDWKEKSTSRKKNFYAWVAFSFKRAFDKSLQDQGIDDWDFWQKGDGKFYNTGDKLHTLTRNVLQYWEKKYNLYLHTDEPNVRGA